MHLDDYEGRDILEILDDNLRYPGFVRFWENLNQFEKVEIDRRIYKVLVDCYFKGAGDEIESAEYTYNRGVVDTTDAIKQHIEDEIKDDEAKKYLLDLVNRAIQ